MSDAEKTSYISKGTKVILPVINFFILFCTIVTGTFAAATWKAEVDSAVETIQQDLKNEVSFRIAENELIKEELKSAEALLLTTQAHLTDIEIRTEAQLTEIQTDLKWIINSMKE